MFEQELANRAVKTFAELFHIDYVELFHLSTSL